MWEDIAFAGSFVGFAVSLAVILAEVVRTAEAYLRARHHHLG